jgi:hypothetical protein
MYFETINLKNFVVFELNPEAKEVDDQHETLDAAASNATRLAKLNPGTHYAVVEIHKVFKAKAATEVVEV